MESAYWETVQGCEVSNFWITKTGWWFGGGGWNKVVHDICPMVSLVALVLMRPDPVLVSVVTNDLNSVMDNALSPITLIVMAVVL